MTQDYESSCLWSAAFAMSDDGFNEQRSMIREAYKHFRDRVAVLLSQIKGELPNLTIHDITHVDSLWRVASEIAGPNYRLNPAEALVLGGAFLLHDAAHCRAAYEGGLEEIRATNEWRDLVAQRELDDTKLTEGSADFQSILFDTLRVMHPKRARHLAFARWPTAASEMAYLFPHDEFREAYGHIIGEIAESHWFNPHDLEVFARRMISAPAVIAPAPWTVNTLKIAVLLRVADAAHIDSKRAPRFLLTLSELSSISQHHWQFQARLNQPHCDLLRQELLITGSAFPADEQEAWWLAFDAATLVDRELQAADHLLRDAGVDRLEARGVAGVRTAEMFSRHVPTNGWQPVDTNIKITNIKMMVDRFGGEKLYGKDPAAALRELLQNAIDAIHACRRLGGLGEEEGEIEVAVESTPNGKWMHITDTGVGMSRYVLTNVLLDFGRSLWRSADLRGEWSGLSASGFESIGQFGIGFFSVFMLSERVKLVTRRFETKEGEVLQWLLEFFNGTNKRPILRSPNTNEQLKRHGTRVSFFLTEDKLSQLLPTFGWGKYARRMTLQELCGRLAPAIDINLFVREDGVKRQCVVRANDWLQLAPFEFLKRLAPATFIHKNSSNFGWWSHTCELEDESGTVLGRCAINAENYSDSVGVGVVKGLFAGNLKGIAGVIFARPQFDLARKSAVPNITLQALQNWTEKQKSLIASYGEIDAGEGKRLIEFGASYTEVTVGYLNGVPVSYEELVDFLKSSNCLLVHDGIVDHENDDDVLHREFEDDFERVVNLLELEYSPRPEWLGEIDQVGNLAKSWTLYAAVRSALHEAWPKEFSESEANRVVGTVNGTKIYRGCNVYVVE